MHHYSSHVIYRWQQKHGTTLYFYYFLRLYIIQSFSARAVDTPEHFSGGAENTTVDHIELFSAPREKIRVY